MVTWRAYVLMAMNVRVPQCQGVSYVQQMKTGYIRSHTRFCNYEFIHIVKCINFEAYYSNITMKIRGLFFFQGPIGREIKTRVQIR